MRVRGKVLVKKPFPVLDSREITKKALARAEEILAEMGQKKTGTG